MLLCGVRCIDVVTCLNCWSIAGCLAADYTLLHCVIAVLWSKALFVQHIWDIGRAHRAGESALLIVSDSVAELQLASAILETKLVGTAW